MKGYFKNLDKHGQMGFSDVDMVAGGTRVLRLQGGESDSLCRREHTLTRSGDLGGIFLDRAKGL